MFLSQLTEVGVRVSRSRGTLRSVVDKLLAVNESRAGALCILCELVENWCKISKWTGFSNSRLPYCVQSAHVYAFNHVGNGCFF